MLAELTVILSISECGCGNLRWFWRGVREGLRQFGGKYRVIGCERWCGRTADFARVQYIGVE